MKKKRKENSGWWKILIVLTFLISMTSLFLLVQNKTKSKIILPVYKDYTKYITLENDNDFTTIDGEIVDYLCDEGVYFNNHEDAYYASTWDGDHNVKQKYKGMTGSCMIKIRRQI